MDDNLFKPGRMSLRKWDYIRIKIPSTYIFTVTQNNENSCPVYENHNRISLQSLISPVHYLSRLRAVNKDLSNIFLQKQQRAIYHSIVTSRLLQNTNALNLTAH